MHEFTIAQAVIEAAEEIAERERVFTLKKVELEIGALSGIVPESLRFALEIATKDTILANTTFKLEVLPGKAECRTCGHEFETSDLLTLCPKCSGAILKITNGKQLKINSITI